MTDREPVKPIGTDPQRPPAICAPVVCGIDAHMKDGLTTKRAAYIEGNRDHPLNKACCAPRLCEASCNTMRRPYGRR
jgi:hypothetical protein